MITLLQNGKVFNPEFVGEKDILITGEKIIGIEDHIDINSDYVKRIDCTGKILVPGFIDGHVHLIGGGECATEVRIQESNFSELIANGVTTALGMLGTDSISKSLESLYTKCVCITKQGIDCYMLTGAYKYPSPTLCGEVMRDLVLVDKVIGCKIALSDHRSSAIGTDKLAELCSQSIVGGLVGGKAGLVVIHMGNSRHSFSQINELIMRTDIPISFILPTHCGRNIQLFKQAIEFAKIGGNIDLTANQGNQLGKNAAELIHFALQEGVSIESITVSSDAYGSQPHFDENMNYLGMTFIKPGTLLEEFRSMVLEENLAMDQAIKVLSTNVAKRMGLENKKGYLSTSYDADIVVMDEELKINSVMARGKILYKR